MIVAFTTVFIGYANPQKSLRLRPDFTQMRNGKTLFTSEQYPTIRLKAEGMIYKLAIIISDNFYCDNYLGVEDLFSFMNEQKFKHIRFDTMSHNELVSKKRIRLSRKSKKKFSLLVSKD